MNIELIIISICIIFSLYTVVDLIGMFIFRTFRLHSTSVMKSFFYKYTYVIGALLLIVVVYWLLNGSLFIHS